MDLESVDKTVYFLLMAWLLGYRGIFESVVILEISAVVFKFHCLRNINMFSMVVDRLVNSVWAEHVCIIIESKYA